MASYKTFIKPSAVKELEAIDGLSDRRRIAKRIQDLAGAPRPPGCEKLSGQDEYHVRQGDYRMVYSSDDKNLAITVVKVGHRREVYR